MRTPSTDLLPLPTLRVIGVDPGGTTGLVCVDVPALKRDAAGLPVWATFEMARYVAHATVRASASLKLSDAEQRASLGTRIKAVLDGWCGALDRVGQPVVIALEEPLDVAAGVWENRTRDVRGHQRDTMFLLGAHYGLALGAAWAATQPLGAGDGSAGSPCPDAGVMSYPVNNYHGRPGWMQGGSARVQSRAAVLNVLRHFAKHIGAPVGATGEDLSEDVLCALGVARFHLGQLHAQRLAMQQAPVRGRAA